MSKGQITGRVIFKCPRCKARWAKDYPVVEREVTRYDYWGNPIRSIRRELPASTADVNGRCPHCNNGYINAVPVSGITKPEHKCDARCTGAKGADCECSCGGANHGADLLAA